MMMKTAIALCLATCAAAKLSQAQVSQLERLKAGDVSKKEIELVLALSRLKFLHKKASFLPQKIACLPRCLVSSGVVPKSTQHN